MATATRMSSRATYNDVDSHTVLARYFIHHSTRTDLACTRNIMVIARKPSARPEVI